MIPPGTRIGAYEVRSMLGAGGMGEVYRARDTKLERDVAIKVLPTSVAGDPERLSRFEREARLLASLNHPHIAAIYGLEESTDVIALVLELVEGDTLEETLHGSPPMADGKTKDHPSAMGDQPSRRGLAVPTALAIARQIADALDAAHERGIVHRDLKPANIKITPEGTVKVLDFGLAKAADIGRGLASGPSDLTHSPTMMAATVQGVLLGTAPYMSPEQARGKSVDKRADIWAFGCVLYEMLARKKAFAGETASDTIAAILEREPDWSALPSTTPPSVMRVLKRCLAKDPRRRLRDIGDVRFELEDVDVVERPTTLPVARRDSPILWLVAGAVLGVAITTGWFLLRQPSQVAREVQQQRLTDFVGMEEAPALAPDGKTVAFVAPAAGKRQIWIRLLAGGVPLQLTHDAVDHEQPRWSPDSSAVIYFSPSPTPGEQGAIWEIPALGGTPRRIAAAASGADVSHDGSRLAVFQISDGRMALSAVARDGSRVERIHQLSADDRFRSPRWSPDDRFVAFSRYDPASFDERMYVVPSTGGELREVGGGLDLRGFCWLADGSGLVYSSAAGSTIAYPPTFNLRLAAIGGRGDRQLTFGDVSYVEPDLGRSGAVVASRVRMQSDIWKFPVGGSPSDNARAGVRVTHQTGQAQTPSVSPDGAELVYLSDSGGHGNLWVAKTDGSGVRQITFEHDPRVTIGVPVWSPRNLITFIYARERVGAVQWLVAPDGSGLREFVRGAVGSYWSGDGQWLYYFIRRETGYCVAKSPVDGGPQVSVRCDNAVSPALTADGSAMYYLTPLKRASGGWDWEVRVARPEGGASRPLARIAASQVPDDPINAQAILLRDAKSLAIPLTNGTTSNVWLVPTDGGPMHAVTDFGDRPTMIVRRVSWSPDGKFLYAAVAETDADIVLLDGLLR